MAADLVRKENEKLLETLEDGDMIEFPRGGYSHWAVYIGHGMVIHIVADPNSSSSVSKAALFCKKAWVMEDELIKVAANSKARKNNDKDMEGLTPLRPEQIVQRARSKLDEKIDYNILWKNCEYFASWCRYGEGWSDQTIDGLILAGILAAVAYVEITKPVGDEEKEKKDVNDGNKEKEKN